MTYELAKELKEAGFPQVNAGDGTTLWYLDPHRFGYLTGDPSDQYVKRVTLSELIEACGERFKSLWRHSGGTWTAEYGTRRIAPRRRCDGPTPEEAVARLWLALNKK